MRGLSSRAQVVVGLAGVVLLVASVTIGVRGALGEFSAGYDLTVRFDRAGQGLDRFSAVRVRGIEVGSVEAIELTEDNAVEVRARVQPDVRVPRSATAVVEASSVFGPKYISLQLGEDEESGPFLEPGDTLGADEAFSGPTGVEGMLDRTNELFTTIQTEDLVVLVRQLAEVWDDQGATLGNTIDSTDTVLEVLHRHQGDTRRFLANVATIAATFGDRGSDIVAVARDLSETLPRLTALDPELTTTLDALHGLTDETASLLEDNRALFQQALRAVVDGILPALRTLAGDAQNLPLLTGAVIAFSDSLSGALHLERPGGLVGALEALLNLDACVLLPDLPCGEGP